MDADETDVDCGAGCAKCADGLTCAAAADCKSTFCNTTTKLCATDHCADTVKDGDETDTDCGGSCPTKCTEGKACAVAGDCTGGLCSPVTNTCVVAHCTDTLKDGDETDLDCGGSCSTKCANGKGCAVAADCTSTFCNTTTQQCIADHCADTVKDGDETAPDCGGSCISKCATGLGCAIPGDCASTFCNVTTKLCVADHCGDAVKNNTETDVDCGGSCTTKCATGQTCAVGADCTNTFCNTTTKTCVDDHCTDTAKDGDETDVDCGGSCATKCAVGKACVAQSDCATGLACHLGTCANQAPPSTGLVGWWPLETGPLVPDASGTLNNGIATGGFTVVAGKVGTALNLDGTACVGIPNSASLTMAGLNTVSVMGWVKYGGTCTQDNCTFWNKENEYEFAVSGPGFLPQGQFTEAVQNKAGPGWFWTGSAGGVIAAGVWHHVAFVWNGANVRRYLDGVSFVTASNPRTLADATGLNTTTNGAGIGCRGVSTAGSTTGASAFFQGVVDEFAVYNRALTALEIKTYYDSTK
jgi:hypothetical protein